MTQYIVMRFLLNVNSQIFKSPHTISTVAHTISTVVGIDDLVAFATALLGKLAAQAVNVVGYVGIDNVLKGAVQAAVRQHVGIRVVFHALVVVAIRKQF